MKKILIWALSVTAIFSVLLLCALSLEPKRNAREAFCQRRIQSLASQPLTGNFWTFRQMENGAMVVTFKKNAIWYVKDRNIFCLTPQAKADTPGLGLLYSLPSDLAAYESVNRR